MILSIENSRIIRIGLLNEKVNILWSVCVSQSDKSSDSSNESASFK